MREWIIKKNLKISSKIRIFQILNFKKKCDKSTWVIETLEPRGRIVTLNYYAIVIVKVTPYTLELTDDFFSHFIAPCCAIPILWGACVPSCERFYRLYIYRRWIQLIRISNTYSSTSSRCSLTETKLGNYFILFHISRPNDNNNWLKQHPIRMSIPLRFRRYQP